MKHKTYRIAAKSETVRGFQLSKNFIFADDLRFDSGGNAEKMLGGIKTTKSLFVFAPAVVRNKVLDKRRDVEIIDEAEIKFESVAGIEQQRIADLRVLTAGAEEKFLSGRAENEFFPHGGGCGSKINALTE
jgi:hypothetical protein